ncbi:MAG TPA: hypothetical protein VF505_14045 [Thermoanaerobaculia bacterium]
MSSALAAIVDQLEVLYGPVRQPVTRPFDIIIAENASYLVDDARRLQVFRRLRDCEACPLRKVCQWYQIHCSV